MDGTPQEDSSSGATVAAAVKEAVAAEVERQLAALAAPPAAQAVAPPQMQTAAAAATALVSMLSGDDEAVIDDPDSDSDGAGGRFAPTVQVVNPLDGTDLSDAEQKAEVARKRHAEEAAAVRGQLRDAMDKMAKRVLAKMHEAPPNLHQATVAICLDDKIWEHEACFFLLRNRRKATFFLSSVLVVALQTMVMLGVLVGVSHPSCLLRGQPLTILGVDMGTASIGRATECPRGDFCGKQGVSSGVGSVWTGGWACEFCLDVENNANGHPSWLRWERKEWPGVVNGTYEDVKEFCAGQEKLSAEDDERCRQCFDVTMPHGVDHGWNRGRNINDAIKESVLTSSVCCGCCVEIDR
eukprot:COSAG01_NODE_8605_length_2721_cov_15.757056_3_plen_353_part_00